MTDSPVDLNGVVLPGPTVAASGCLRSLRDVRRLLDVRKLGGIVTETLTAQPMVGQIGHRGGETPSGLLTNTGYQNMGVEAFLERSMPLLVRTGVPVIVSVGGTTVENVIRTARVLTNISEIAAIEMNLAFPSEERGGLVPAARGDHAAELVGAVGRMVSLPVFAKLPPDAGDVVEVALACRAAGAHGFTLIAGPQAAAGTAHGVRLGSLSGPAIRPLAVRAVAAVAAAIPDAPIFGCGGVEDGVSAMELLDAGAWAVQVGTAMLVHPDAPLTIAAEIADALEARQSTLSQLREPHDVQMVGVPERENAPMPGEEEDA